MARKEEKTVLLKLCVLLQQKSCWRMCRSSKRRRDDRLSAQCKRHKRRSAQDVSRCTRYCPAKKQNRVAGNGKIQRKRVLMNCAHCIALHHMPSFLPDVGTV